MLFRSFSATGSKLRPSVQDLALDVLPLSLALPEVERLIQDFRIPLYKGFYLIEEAIQFAQQYLGDSFFISPHLSPDLQEPSGEIVKTTLAPLAGGRQIKWYQSFFIYIWKSPSILQIFGSALLCSVLPRVALVGGVLPGFLVCREFLHFSPRRLPSQPDPVLLAGVSWYDGQPFYV
ncbi:hypothetical protein SLEP1_g41089 [Rubroshorea leprosula]|uniref:Uncharacterized protein n=1 Tax=Rubroshorea leprosula TaxID=152421 RepID=A0AAV5L5E7_9ROSI|nr:hypothetical protein SLEP1_g41089 [Rubroshorea leprosula]